jgi:transient receptor potential cation channel subfamily C
MATRKCAHDPGFHFAQVQKEMAAKMQTSELPREDWDTWDPMLISEGLFSAANIFR